MQKLSTDRQSCNVVSLPARGELAALSLLLLEFHKLHWLLLVKLDTVLALSIHNCLVNFLNIKH